MGITSTIDDLKQKLAGSIQTVMPSIGIPSSGGNGGSNLSAWTVITFYEKGGPRPGRTIGTGGSSGEQWVLPLPADLSDLNSFEYQPIEYGSMTKAIMGAVTNTAETVGLADSGNQTEGDSSEAGFGGTAVAVGTGTLDLMGADNLSNAIRQRNRITGNPNMEALFKSPNLRTFQFSWSVTPLTQEDSVSLKAFLTKIKESIYPEGSEVGASANAVELLNFPYEFIVSFYSKASGSGGPILIFSTASCVVTDFTVQYTPNGGFHTHIDGNPTSISINATFQEVYILTRQDVVQLGKKY